MYKFMFLAAMLAMACGGEAPGVDSGTDPPVDGPIPVGAWTVVGIGSCGTVSFKVDVDDFGSSRSDGSADVCPISVGITNPHLSQYTVCGRVQELELDFSTGRGEMTIGECSYALLVQRDEPVEVYTR